MSEAEERALGAEGKTITIAGKECSVRPLGLKELAMLEGDCLAQYKRQCMETYAENVDLLPKDSRERLLEDKWDEIGRWDLNSMPTKFAYDPVRIELSDKLKAWLLEHWGLDGDEPRMVRLQQLTAASMDQSTLSEDDYRSMTGKIPPRVRVPYSHWWITGCYEGMIALIWRCFRRDGVTREQVTDALSDNPTEMAEMAREIERLSAPQAGNG